MKEESQNHRPDPELEARIVSLMFGEASELEREQLQHILEEHPELLVFKAKMESVHELMREVATGEFPTSNEDWKLPAEKRNAVLAVINPEVKRQPAKTPTVSLSIKNGPFKRFNLASFAKIAAVFCVMGFFGVLAFSSLRGRSKQIASNRAPSADGFDKYFGRTETSAKELTSEGMHSKTFSENRYFQAERGSSAEPVLDRNSKTALLAIRDSLGNEQMPATSHFRNDDFLTDQIPEAPVQRHSGESHVRSLKGVEESKAGAGITLSAVPDAGASIESKAKSFDVVREGRWTENAESSNAWGSLGTAAAPRPAISEIDGKVREQVLLGEASGGAVSNFGASVGQSGASGSVTALGALGDKNGQLQKPLEESRIDLDIPRPSAAKPSASPDNGRDFDSEKSGPQQQSAPTTPLSRRGTDSTYFVEPANPTAAGVVAGVQGSLAFDNNAGRKDGYSGVTKMGAGVLTLNGVDTKSLFDMAKTDTVDDVETIGERSLRFDLAKNAPLKAQIQGKGSVEMLEKKAEEASVVDLFTTNSFSPSAPSASNPPTSGKMGSTKSLNEREPILDADGEVTRLEVITIKPSNESSVDKGKRTRDEASLGRGTANEEKLDALFADSKPEGDEQADLRLRFWNKGTSSLKGTPFSPTDSKANKDGLTDEKAIADTILMTDTPRILIEGEVEQRKGEVAQKFMDGVVYSGAATSMAGRMPDVNKFVPRKAYIVPEGLNELRAADDAFSTFSLYVSDVSFKLARAALAQGEWPEAAKIRIEEFVNAIDYGDPLPKQGEKVACRVEQSIHPFLQQRNLLRVSMRTSAAGRASNTPLRLTLLLDNSGSMERFDRQQTVRRAFATLAGQLQPIDQVTLISFARQPRLLADKISGTQSNQLLRLVGNLPSEGGTNIEAALQLAFEKAKEQQTEGAQNRIVLLTDGAVNLGDANPESLSRMITTMRDSGIAFDAAGISADGLNDEVLEALTRKGDGRYYLLDSAEAADDGFARQIAGALRPSAKNVKVQVEFNPKRVGHYKLLGFEKHVLKQEDFRNDKVDAAEMAAAEAGVAVYQFEAKPDGEGDVGSVSVRFQDLTTGEMVEHCWPIPYEPGAARPEKAAPSMRIASCAALFAAKLRGDPLGGSVDLKTLSELLSGLPQHDRNGKPVQQLQSMIDQARQVSGK